MHVGNTPSTVQNVVTYNTVVAVETAELKFKPGMTASVSIIIAHREGVLQIRNAALRFRLPRGFAGTRVGEPGTSRVGAPFERTVYVIPDGENSQPVPVSIRTGITDGALTEVVEGLKEGDLVVIAAEVGTARRER